MSVSITIDKLDPEVVERLRAEAQQRGVDVSVVVKELIYERLGPADKEDATGSCRDLKALAGTWSPEEAKEFLSVIADFTRVDEDLWN